MNRLFADYPFINLRGAMLLLRLTTPILFMAHAVVRIAKNTIPNFAIFMQDQGFPYPTAWVWAITVAELIAGCLILLNYQMRWAASVLFTIAAVGIALIHRNLGWFVGEHGVGGSEYSVALMVMLVVLAAADRDKASAT